MLTDYTNKDISEEYAGVWTPAVWPALRSRA
jgi:hypothetical protein